MRTEVVTIISVDFDGAEPDVYAFAGPDGRLAQKAAEKKLAQIIEREERRHFKNIRRVLTAEYLKETIEEALSSGEYEGYGQFKAWLVWPMLTRTGAVKPKVTVVKDKSLNLSVDLEKEKAKYYNRITKKSAVPFWRRNYNKVK